MTYAWLRNLTGVNPGCCGGNSRGQIGGKESLWLFLFFHTFLFCLTATYVRLIHTGLHFVVIYYLIGDLRGSPKYFEFASIMLEYTDCHV